MKLTKFCTVLACALLGYAASPTKTVKRASSPFVRTDGTGFIVNGSEFSFIGTNAYWLPALNEEQDIINTLSNISALGITVVRVWGFNDVTTIPENGTWFQLISANGTQTLNNGTNGLQKLDMVLDAAQNLGIYVLLTLTNNWAPLATDNLTEAITGLENSVSSRDLQNRAVANTTNATRPRNFLSNDYGGIDTYIRQFGGQTHDEFYTNQTFINAYMNYTGALAARYTNHTAVLSWEIANDPRCNSSIAGAPTCTSQNITAWHQTIATHILSVDPNHLVSSGSQGYLCPDCPKNNPVPTPAPPPQPSPRAVNDRRRTVKPITTKRIFQDIRERWKKTRALVPRSEAVGQGVRVRGRWISTPTRRQDLNNPGDQQQTSASFDGSQGVDAGDILGNPNIGFGSFQLFPDQNTYFPNDPSLSPFENTLQNGIDWIILQGELAKLYGKPVILLAFGLVTQANAPFFVPFNTTVAPFANTSTTVTSTGTASNPNATQGFVTDSQQDTAYSQWLSAGQANGVSGLMQYQWSQSNLTAEANTPISPNDDTAGQSSNDNQTGQSPNDGYSPQTVSQTNEVQGILQNATQTVTNV